MRTVMIGVLALAAAALGLVVSERWRADAQATASVRVIHLAVGAGAVDVTVDGQALVANVGFRAASDYLTVPAGRRTIRFAAAGQPAQALAEGTIDVPAGQALTIAATGEAPAVTALVIPDDNSAPPAGQARVRFVHGAPDVPPVDVAARGGQVLFTGVGFREVENYVNLPAGTYTLEMRPAGQTAVSLAVPNVTLTAGQVVTIFAAGKAADNSLAAVLVVYQPTVPGVGSTAQVLPVGPPRTGLGLLADQAPVASTYAAVVALLILIVAAGGIVAARRRP